MKRFSKKLAALLLVAVMAVSLFPSSVFAADEAGNNDPAVVEQTGGLVEDETDAAETTAAEETTAEEKTSDETTAEETATPETTAEETSPAEEATAPEEATAAPTETSAAEPTVPETPVAPVENSITAQPQDAIVAPYGKAVFEVQTIGKVSSYKWQYSTNNGWSWWNYGSKKSSITVTGSKNWWNYNNGNMYRCIVTFKDGTEVTSDAATLYVASAQSFKNSAKKADNADVSVKAPAGTFPDETSMEVTDVVAEDYVEAISQELGSVTASDITAVDISFKYGGEEIEPANDNKVTVTITSDAIKADSKIVHIDDFGNAEEVEIVSIKDGEVVFMSDAFSVYAVVSGDEIVTDTITYHFLDGEGNPYPFLNTAGQTVTNQIIKDGEALQEIPAPGLLGENAFNGWYYFDKDNNTWGEEVTFGVPISVTETKDVYIKAHYGSVIYVTFYQYARDKADGNVVLERRQVPLDETGKGTIDMSSVTVPAPKTTLKFMGWSLEPGSDASEDTGDVPGERELLPNSNVEFTEDTDVYPVYYNGLWIVFVSAETGMGATYVPGFFVAADSEDASAAKPEDPTMTGYAFDDWYTEKEPVAEYVNPDAGNYGEKFDFNTSFEELADFVNPETGEVILYGHWKPGSTSYVVVYWKQQVGNSKNATDSQKTYDYAGQTDPITANTGSTPTPTPAQQSADTGFQYSRYELVDVDAEGHATPSTGIKPDGSTILNVYFDRKTITMRFSTSTNINYNDNWNNATTYTGLYGQTWAQAGYTGWPAPANNTSWQYFNNNNGMTGMTFLGEFVLPNTVRDTNKVEIRFRRLNNSSVTLHIIQQDVNGNYPTSDTFTGAAYGGTFNVSDKFEGYYVAQYRTGTNGQWRNISHTTNADGSHTYNPSTINVTGVSNLYIRYARESYEIKYLNPLNENPVLTAQTKLFGAALTSAKPTVTEVDLGVPGYEWDGKWYKDKNCTEEFDFSTETMPMGGTKVYAGKTPLYYFIKIDPNGGELQTGQSTWRWVKYGDDSTYTYDNITRDYIEYKGTGTAYYYYYDEFDISRRDDIWNYDYMASNPRTARYTTGSIPAGGGAAWLGTDKFSYEADAYALIGWYDITDGEANMKPFKTGTAITRDTIIQAQWRRTGEYGVKYSVEAVDENGQPLMKDGVRVQGSDAPSDAAKYADKSDSAIMDKLKLPAGYNFVGWYYNGNVYQPGDVFQVLARLSDDNKLVWIYPVMEPVETLPVEVIDITFDPNGGQFTDKADTEIDAIIAATKTNDDGTYNPQFTKNDDGTYSIEKLKINESMNLLSAAAVERGVIIDGEMVPGRGYRLKEWNTKADGSGTSFSLDTKIGVDDKNPIPNTVYAIWEELFYVYHSSDNTCETVVITKSPKDRWTYTKGFDPEGTKDKTQYTEWYYGGFAVYAAGDVAADGFTFEGGDVKQGTIASTYWTRSKAAKSGDAWNPSDVGAVYYLKEVPTWYLPQPKAVVVKDNYGAGDITSIHFVTVTDTNIYRAGGVKVNDDYKGTFSKTFSVTQHNGTTDKYTPEGLYGDDRLTGYFSVVTFSDLTATTYQSCQGYWLTYDNVKVYGIEENIRDIIIE